MFFLFFLSPLLVSCDVEGESTFIIIIIVTNIIERIFQISVKVDTSWPLLRAVERPGSLCLPLKMTVDLL